jgi:hypothetical protein
VILGLFELCISPDGGGVDAFFPVALTVATVMTVPTVTS